MDSEAYLGEIDINPSMVSFWERDPKNMRATWYLSIAYAIKAGQLTFEDLRKYRKDYRESKRYKSYLRSNPNHNERMFALRQEQLSNQLCESEEDRIDREFTLKVKVRSASLIYIGTKGIGQVLREFHPVPSSAAHKRFGC